MLRRSDVDRPGETGPIDGGRKLAYLPHVDGLRAIAIVTVVLYHAWPSALPGGFIGVDVFFVISGFLITRIIAGEMDEGRFSFIAFLARRVRRLVPASFAMLVVVLAAGAVILRPDTLKSLGHAVLYTCGLIANVHFYRTAGYFSAPPEDKPLLHMWSLAVEDQFYLTWPLLLLALTLYLSRNKVIVVVLVLAIASLIHAQIKLGADPDYSFYMLQARSWELLVGCLLALAAPAISLSDRTSAAMSWTGLVAILLSAALLSPTVAFPGLSAVPAVVGTALVIAGGLRGGNGVVRILSLAPVVFIGLISYSLYLWHWPILSLSHYALDRPANTFEVAAAVFASVAVAVVSWRYVELPFRRPKTGRGEVPLRTVAVGIAFLMPVFLIGSAFKVRDGFPERFGGAKGQIFADLAQGNPLRPTCDGFDQIRANDAKCNFGRKRERDQSYDVAVFGDSNADHFVPGIAVWARAKNLAGRQVTQSACAFIPGVERPGIKASVARECADYQAAALRFVETNPNLKLAILGGAWHNYLGMRDNPAGKTNGVTSVARDQPQASGANAFEVALARTVDFLLARGIKVHIIAQIPWFETLPVKCVVDAVATGASTRACGVARAHYDKAQGRIDAALAQIAASRPGVSVSYPSDLVCDATTCSPYSDGVFMYRNGTHLSLAGSLKMRHVLKLPEVR